MSHRTLIFLFSADGMPQSVSQGDYVRLLHRLSSRPDFAGQLVRFADWYLHEEPGQPPHIDSERYGFLQFDDRGQVSDPAAREPVQGAIAWQPSAEDLARLDGMVFGATSERSRPRQAGMR